MTTGELALLAVVAAAAIIILVMAVRSDLKKRPDLKLLHFPGAETEEGGPDGTDG